MEKRTDSADAQLAATVKSGTLSAASAGSVGPFRRRQQPDGPLKAIACGVSESESGEADRQEADARHVAFFRDGAVSWYKVADGLIIWRAIFRSPSAGDIDSSVK